MRIQYCNGGLANQVFQYIFYRYAQIEQGQQYTWFLDDSFFYFRNEHNGYELEKVFGLKPNLLSNRFDEEAWKVFIENRKNGIGTAQTIADLGFPIQMIAEAENYRKDNPFHGKVYAIPCNEYHPEVLGFPGEILYYFGYWINKGWFYQYRDLFLEELSFPPILDGPNLSYASQIKNTLSVGVHIRCGDFITYGWALTPKFYLDSARKMVETYPDLTFFVFSDDIPYCREHADDFGLTLAKDIVFVEGNTDGQNYRDMQLLSLCKGLLMSNSSFCYLAALLNQNLEFCINPTPHQEI